MPDVASDVWATVVGLIGFASFSWAVRWHFQSSSMAVGMKLVSLLSIVALLVHVVTTWLYVQPPLAMAGGTLAMSAAVILFWWAIHTSRSARLKLAFDLALPTSLLTAGPYRYIRHPLYASYGLFWAGWSIAAWSLLVAAPTLFLMICYAIAATREDAAFRASEVSDLHARYKRATGAVIPRFVWRARG